MNRIDLEGRHAVVTGGAQGIGLAVARRLGGSGAEVTLWDRDAGLLRETVTSLGRAGITAFGEDVDVTDAEGVAAAAVRTEKRRGIDVLVNNAGIAGKNATLADYPVEEWRRVMDV